MKTKVWKNNMFLLKFCFRAAPKFLVMQIINSVRQEVVVFLEFTLCLNYVLECAEFGRPFWKAGLFLACVMAFVILTSLFDSWYWLKLRDQTIPAIKQRFKEKLYAKAKEIDIECYDNPEFYNDYVLAVAEADNQIDRVLQMLSNFCQAVTVIVCAGGFFLVKEPLSFVFIAVSFAGTFFIGKLRNKLNYKIRISKNPFERKLAYINRVFYLNDYAKEIRLNAEASGELLKDFGATNDETLSIDKKNAKKRFWLSFVRDYLLNDFIMDVLYISYLVWKAAVLRQISYANVAVLYGSSGRLKRYMGTFAEIYPYAQETSLYVDKILKFLELQPKIVSEGNVPVPDEPTEIVLKNVSFGYGDNYVLKNINMRIDPRKKVAIVGYNGAGKTTLIKLIMRLYDPNEGEVLLNGVNIKRYNLAEYREKIGTVFQDFKIFAATVKENVLLDFAENADEGAVCSALENAGFAERLASLPGGLNANLTTEFEDDGVNLSGGEAQKVAIARVFYAKANTIILDEPSSALDPIAEYNLNNSMLTAAENKSVVFISHRLSTTCIADDIYMMEGGAVIEHGTHAELLALSGKYAYMWNAQAGRYIVA
ncbi:ABC transporter permease [Clostridia bacterium]|nr:ABC transporter permease [Clostridia bacterium]